LFCNLFFDAGLDEGKPKDICNLNDIIPRVILFLAKLWRILSNLWDAQAPRTNDTG
jgi:hypothetical protein